MKYDTHIGEYATKTNAICDVLTCPNQADDGPIKPMDRPAATVAGNARLLPVVFQHQLARLG